MENTACDRQQAESILRSHLDSGRAREKFEEMVVAQGGDPNAARRRAPESVVLAETSGYLRELDAAALGMLVVDLGGGRAVLGQAIDHSVGLEMFVRVGDRIDAGQPLVRLFAREGDHEWAAGLIAGAVKIADEPGADHPLIAERIAN
jgi:thymidine phosphorylase